MINKFIKTNMCAVLNLLVVVPGCACCLAVLWCPHAEKLKHFSVFFPG